MKNRRITINCDIPNDVTERDLEVFLEFKFLGGSIGDETLSKFKQESLDVNSIFIDE